MKLFSRLEVYKKWVEALKVTYNAVYPDEQSEAPSIRRLIFGEDDGRFVITVIRYFRRT